MQFDFKNLDNKFGVYLFKDGSDKVLYIGKAINLRARVRSYWQEKNWKDRPKLAVLVPQIADIETIITQNEKEALMLEASLIYKYQPKYNVLLKDNKNFPWIAISYGEPFPRLIPVRDLKWIKKKYPSAKLFGPYTAAGSMYQTLQTAREIFPLRKRATPLFKDRPCLNYHLGKCLAPCQALVSEEEYNNLLKQLEMFLQGRHAELIEELKNKMQMASEEMRYEQAGKYRDQIKILEKTLESQRIITDDPDCERDLIGFAFNETDLCLQIFKMRTGRLIGREAYEANFNELQSREESLMSMLEQAYLLRPVEDIPKEIFLQEYFVNFNLASAFVQEKPFDEHLKQFLSSLKEKSNLQVLFPKRGEKKEQIELAAYNALQQLESQQKQKTKALLALENLQTALNLENIPLKIDCFDISHLQGTQVVASCVRLKDALPDKSKYRKIKLSIDQNNDFYSMKEAVFRRYNQSQSGKEIDLPDLIVIDGGKGQLGAAMQALEELNLSQDVSIISLAKREEEIFTSQNQKIVLSRNSPALQVVQRARDEAHRFALNYNRARRAKSLKQSALDEIVGIGDGLKERLKKNFTLEELQNVSPQELELKLKVNAKRADRIWQLLQNQLREN